MPRRMKTRRKVLKILKFKTGKILQIINNICPRMELFPQIKADCRACSNLALIGTPLAKKTLSHVVLWPPDGRCTSNSLKSTDAHL